MEALLSKLISILDNFYLATYIIAGAGVILGLKFVGINIYSSDFWVNLGVCYFAGMISSRIGSLIIEYLCIKSGFIKKEVYKRFLDAERKDQSGKLLSMSKVSGLYLTMSAVSLIIFLTSLIFWIINPIVRQPYIYQTGCSLLIFILFLFSYRKQNQYVVKRIQALSPSNN